MALRQMQGRRVWCERDGREMAATVARAHGQWAVVVIVDRRGWPHRHRVRLERVRPREEPVEGDETAARTISLENLK